MDQLLKAGQSFLQSQGGGNNNDNERYGNDSNNRYGNDNNNNNEGRYGNDNNDDHRRYNNDNNNQYGGGNDNYANEGRQQQHHNQGSNSGGGGGFDLGSLAGLVQNAQHHDSNNSGSSDLFSQAASYLQNSGATQSNGSDIDEQQMMQSHEKVQQGGQAHSGEIGQAAALGALKNFIGGGGGGSSTGSNEGGFQQKIIAMAMAQASQMFDQKQANGEVSGGDKQSAVNQAGEYAMKLMLKHQVSGMIGGGQSGGLGSLAKLLM